MQNRPRFGNGPQQAAAIRGLKNLPNNVPILGQGGCADRFGRPIGIHDVVEVTNLDNYRPLFRVIGFEPNLDPRATVGSIKVSMVAEFVFGGVAGQATGNLLRVLTAAEQGIQPEAPEGEAPPAPAPDTVPDQTVPSDAPKEDPVILP